MERLQIHNILNDLDEKMVFVSGPRQVGKTTLSLSLKDHFSKVSYFNYDEASHRKIIINKQWPRDSDLVIFDEIHKLKKWKTHLKGTFDTEGIPPRILVTGSARLNIFRRGGDSLAGRTFNHRLYPFSVKELSGTDKPQNILENLIRFGGFPEPYLKQSDKAAARWRKQHLERIIRIDVQDLQPVKDIQTLILLIDLLKQRVGSPISYNSLAQDLEISPHTVKRWIEILENMYVIFKVTPYHKNLARSLLKEPKIYFYDTGCVEGDDGIKFENCVANCLLKHLHFLEDNNGQDVKLHYLRNKEKKEVDFLTMVDRKVDSLIEVKLADGNLNSSLDYFHQRIKPKHSLQLVMDLKQEKSIKGISILKAADWLGKLSN